MDIGCHSYSFNNKYNYTLSTDAWKQKSLETQLRQAYFKGNSK